MLNNNKSINLNVVFLFQTLSFLFFFIDFDGYYIVRTDEGQPRPKYILNKCGTNIYFFTLQRFGPSPSLNFKSLFHYGKLTLNLNSELKKNTFLKFRNRNFIKISLTVPLILKSYGNVVSCGFPKYTNLSPLRNFSCCSGHPIILNMSYLGTVQYSAENRKVVSFVLI